MIYNYVFADGDRSTVEVDEELAMYLKDSDREFDNYERKERYHAEFSIDWEIFPDNPELADECTPESLLELKEDNAQLYEALKELTPIQRRRLMMLADGMNMAEIARAEGTEFNPVKRSITGARKKIIGILRNRGQFSPPKSPSSEGDKSSTATERRNRYAYKENHRRQ